MCGWDVLFKLMERPVGPLSARSSSEGLWAWRLRLLRGMKRGRRWLRQWFPSCSCLPPWPFMRHLEECTHQVCFHAGKQQGLGSLERFLTPLPQMWVLLALMYSDKPTFLQRYKSSEGRELWLWGGEHFSREHGNTGVLFTQARGCKRTQKQPFFPRAAPVATVAEVWTTDALFGGNEVTIEGERHRLDGVNHTDVSLASLWSRSPGVWLNYQACVS